MSVIALYYAIEEYRYIKENAATKRDIEELKKTIVQVPKPALPASDENVQDNKFAHQPNQYQQPSGTVAVPSSLENDISAAQENVLTIVLDSDNSKSIWTTSVYSYAHDGGPGGGLDNDQLRIGGWGDEYWSLLQFDLSSAPKLADRATLQLYNEGRNATPTPFDVYVIDQDWGWTRGDRLWWRDRPTEMHRVLSVSAPQSYSWVSIDITDVYNKWQSGTPNYGIALRPLYTNNNFDQFRSTKFADATYRPRVLITVARQSR